MTFACWAKAALATWALAPNPLRRMYCALMNKHHQKVEQMTETARKAELAGIHVTFNLILGYPGETEADRQQTFRIMSDIARQYWNVSFSPNIFTPYPGIPIWPQLKELGLHEPQSLEEWEALPLGRNMLPWLQGEELRRLRRSARILPAEQSDSQGDQTATLGSEAVSAARLVRPYVGASAQIAIRFPGSSGCRARWNDS